MTNPNDDELEPELVLQVLREKLMEAKKRVAGVRVDIMVVDAIPGHSEDELKLLQKQLEAARQGRDGYQTKLDEMTNFTRSLVKEA